MFVRMIALILMAIVLIPGGAHLFELPGKIGMERDAYFTVQMIYAGWALFAIPIFGAILANVALFGVLRRERNPAAPFALLSAGLILVSLAIFFAWVFPGNRATANWTTVPDNWDSLRQSWEYGHATNAVITFMAFVSTAIAATRR